MSDPSAKAPLVVVVAGPNGAGKTTAARRMLAGELRVDNFVNADVIARGLSGFAPDSVAADASRIMLRRLDRLGQVREDFALETTLASRTHAARVRDLKSKGYRFHLIFLYLRSADQAVERVAGRVASGGHNVPEDVIRARYQRGLKNFFTLYRPLADGWYFYDNSHAGDPRLIASGSLLEVEEPEDPTAWQELKRLYGSS